MPMIQCIAIEKPVKKFRCEVIRHASSFRYLDAPDYTWKPIRPKRQETWTVLAETMEGAKRIAEYHFYDSSSIKIYNDTP
ncbi:MAG TPA: hypothetical protein VEB40_00905 [Flavipsychrobacter sp.]|nr:hypothetical protein [Flavipsychrobacter sp.]